MQSTMPGYTGFKPQSTAADIRDISANISAHGSHVPGYQGYVPGVKPENVFGSTYAKSSEQSLAGNIPQGFNTNNADRYTTVSA